ncbi:MAG: PAC2 family protein, partial [Nitrososphaerales archaeon]
MMVLKIIPEYISFKGLSLITGFHGIGATGYWTVKYLIQKVGAERVAFVDSEITPPITSNEDGRLATPYEIFRKRDMVFFKVEAPPYKSEDMYFFKEFSDFVVEAGFKEAALIGGLDSRLKVDKST